MIMIVMDSGIFAKTGEHIEIECLLPEVQTTGYVFSNGGIEYGFGLLTPKGFQVKTNLPFDGSDPVFVNKDGLVDPVFSVIENGNGDAIGFRVSGVLLCDIDNIYINARTGAFDNEKPFSGTITLIHNTHDDLRYRIKKEAE